MRKKSSARKKKNFGCPRCHVGHNLSLARTKEELDTVFHGSITTERLKDQTRYRLLVVEQRITLTDLPPSLNECEKNLNILKRI